MSETALAVDVAVVGMAGRFPGAPDLDRFWDNLVRGVETISFFDDAELRRAGVEPAVLDHPRVVRARAVLEGAEEFDADFFGVPAREAELMDPQQRLFLEACYQALEDAGYDPRRAPGRVGVFAGASIPAYLLHNLHGNPAVTEGAGAQQVRILNRADTLATRVSYKLGLTGPSFTVQTACSTSLVAVHLACQSLLSGESDMALVGGVSVFVPQAAAHVFQEGGIASSDGHCRAFDAAADGTVGGNGLGVLVLRRLEDAERDGDTVRAIIKGSALNNDGARKVGFTAPSVEGQAEVIADALAMAGVDPSTVGYVEAHGTGTPLGDPVEVAALTEAFRGATRATGFCALGSVKSNVGHLDAAAGVAGLIKTVLALEHGQIPPSLHVRRPNPEIDFAASPFYVADRLQDWPEDGHPRRAGVSSFGIGGTNVHLVLEAAPVPEPSTATPPPWLLTLSARSSAALATAGGELAAWLRGHPRADLADVAYTLAVGRGEHPHRRAVVAATPEAAAAALEDPRAGAAGAHEGAGRPVVFLFSGQGSQHPGMAHELYRDEPVFRRELDRCGELLAAHGADPRPAATGVGAGGASDEELAATALAQPALFAVEYALARLWQSWGVEPAALLGHSVGELVAACLAGVFELPDALALVAERGRLMQACPPGAMLAVALPEAEAAARLAAPGLAVAAINEPGRTVISGPAEEVDALAAALASDGVVCRRLHTSHGFHSPAMEPAAEAFAERVARVPRRAPERPLLSNVTGTWARPEEVTDPGYWGLHLRSPVRFADAVAAAAAERSPVLLEVGPGNALAAVAGRAAPGVTAVASLPPAGREAGQRQALVSAAGRLWAAGAPVDRAALLGAGARRRLPLPTYPFERRRYWIDPPSASPLPAVAAPAVAPAPAPPVPEDAASDPALSAVLALVGRVSGLDPAGVSPGAGFFELGFDSLLLMQLSQRVEAELGAVVPFRHLFDELPSPAALADRLRREVPAERLGLAPPPAAERSAEPADFGPFRPHRSAAVDLTPHQRGHLRELVAHHTARTSTSRRFAEEHRRVLADPRATLGFRADWKDLVYPLVVERSEGAHVWDADGHRYVDLVMGFGVNLFGHAPAFITEAVSGQLQRGLHLGAQVALAGRVARGVAELTGMDRVAFCNTGSEAVTAAVRAARTVTGRRRIALFAGSYHGISDGVLARSLDPAGGAPPVPVALGIPPGMVEDVVVLEYGRPGSLERLGALAGDLAAVLVEPVQSSNPELQPAEFLHDLRRLTQEAGCALVFDEAVTGFRIHPGGAQAHFGVDADFATYSKIIGGGMPIGVVAGRGAWLDAVDGGPWSFDDDSSPAARQTFFAGTFAKHPLALAAADAVLERLREEGPRLQRRLNERAAELVERLREVFATRGVDAAAVGFGSQFRFRLSSLGGAESLFYHHLVDRGVHLWQGRTCFLSTAHRDEDLERVVEAVDGAVEALQDGGFFTGAPVPAAFTPGAGTAAPDGDASAPYPLTPGQAELWALAELGEEASRAYNETTAWVLRGSLDRVALRRAVGTLVTRHEALRLRFDPEGESQRVAPPGAAPLLEVDLTALAADRRPAARDRCLSAVSSRPFDLATGTPVRFLLVRVEEGEHSLARTAHHLAFDGWSSGVLSRELFALYDAAACGGRPALPPAPGFRRYALEETGAAGRERAEAALEAACRRLTPPPPPLDLPADRRRSPRRRFRGGRVSRWLRGAELAALRRAAARSGNTVQMALLAALSALLHRLSGQDDLVVALPSAGQAAPGWEGLVGYCVRLLAVRSRGRIDTTLSAVAAGVRRELLDAAEQPAVPFYRLLDELGVERDPARPRLASVILNFERAAAGVPPAGLEVEALPGPARGAKVDLQLDAAEAADRLRLEWVFDADLFDAATAERWARAFERTLAALGDEPSPSLGALSLLSPDERHQVLREWNDSEGPAAPGSLHRRIAEQAARTPDAVATIYDGAHRSYDALDRQARGMAERLRRLGVGVESRVAVLMERSAELLPALLGVLYAGAAYVPLDPDHPDGRSAGVVAGLGLPVVLVQRHLAERAADWPVRSVVVVEDEIAGTDGEVEPPLPDEPPPGAAAYAIYTSGSTGTPKGAVNSHAGIANRIDWMQRRYRLGSGDRVLQKTPFSFDVSVWELFWPLTAGAAVVVAPPRLHRDPAGLAAAVERHRVSTLHFVPSMLRVFLEDEETAPRCGSLTRVIASGEALDAEAVRRFFERLPGTELHNLYGPTEAAVDVTAWPCRPGRDAGGTVPIGRPIDNLEVVVLDAASNPSPVGVPGELYLSGVGLARGYLAEPVRTAELFGPHPLARRPGERAYRTGDRCRLLADGAVEYLERVDHQVKLRGFRIELGEVEAALVSHPGVSEAVVVLAGGATPRLAAYVVAGPGSTAGPAELTSHLARRLPDYMLPAAFVGVEELPRTTSGKVDRRALASRPLEIATPAAAERRAPRGELEHLLWEEWARVLGHRELGVEDDFFALGGDSLQAARLLARLRKLLRTEVRVGALFNSPTIRGLAAALTAAEAQPGRLEAIARVYHEVRAMDSEEARRLLGGALEREESAATG